MKQKHECLWKLLVGSSLAFLTFRICRTSAHLARGQLCTFIIWKNQIAALV